MAFNKTKEDLITFLATYHAAGLATIKPGNIAHATTIYYYSDPGCNFYFLTKDLTGKFDNIKDNQTVGLVITDNSALQTVQVEGLAGEVDYSKQYAKEMQAYTDKLSKFGQQWEQIPLNHLAEGYYAFVRIVPKWILWKDFKNWGNTVQYEQRFD